MDNIREEYKSFSIEFVEFFDEWRALMGDDVIYSNISLKAVKDYIDRQLKKNFTKFTAYYQDWREYIKVTITSQDDAGNYWYTDGKGKRGKATGNLYADSPENVEIFEKIKEANAKETQLILAKDKLFASLIKVGK